MPQKKTKNAAHLEAFILPPICDATAVAALHSAFAERINGGSNLSLNAASVEKITTPCIQLLLSAYVSATNHKVELKIEQPSEAFVAAFSFLGLSAQLEAWSR